MQFVTFVVAVAALSTSAAFAQVKPNPYALRMATQAADTVLPGLKPLMDAAFDKLEQDASKPNAPPSAKIFVQEFRNSFNRENFISVLSKSIGEYFTDEDFSEIQKYEESRVGLKAAKFNEQKDMSKMVAPILKMACDRTLQRLNAIGQQPDEGFKTTCNK